MSFQATGASPSKRHPVLLAADPPEREAKRQHVEQFGDLERAVKDEPQPDDAVADALAAVAQDGDTGGDIAVGDLNCSTDLDSLIESVRVLASYRGDYHVGNEFVKGAFRFVFEQTLELINCPSLETGSPQFSLNQWLKDLLARQKLPLQSLTRISVALQREMSIHVAKSWLSKHNPSAISSTLEMLQDLKSHNIHDVSDVIRLLQGRKGPLENAKARSETSAKTSSAKKTRATKKAKSEPLITTEVSDMNSGRPQSSKSGELVPATITTTTTTTSNSKQERDSGQPKNTTSTSRGKSETLTTSEKSLLERQQVSQALPSSSPALVKFREECASSKVRASGIARRTALEPSVSKDTSSAHQSQSRSTPAPSTLVRYLKPSDSSLLVFFIGPSINTMLEQEVDTACKEAFGKGPRYANRWSENVWVAHMYSMPDVYADVITVQGIQLTAKETHSEPKRYFVACCTGFDVEDDILKKAIDNRPKRALGPCNIYRAPPASRLRSYVFLEISKEPPKPFIYVTLVDDSGQHRDLTFAPAIMDIQEPCFYCNRLHDDLICSDAVQLSKYFSEPS